MNDTRITEMSALLRDVRRLANDMCDELDSNHREAKRLLNTVAHSAVTSIEALDVAESL